MDPVFMVGTRAVVGRGRWSTCKTRPPIVIEGGLVIPKGIWGNQEKNIGFICLDTCLGILMLFRHVPLKVACAYHPITK